MSPPPPPPPSPGQMGGKDAKTKKKEEEEERDSFHRGVMTRESSQASPLLSSPSSSLSWGGARFTTSRVKFTKISKHLCTKA